VCKAGEDGVKHGRMGYLVAAMGLVLAGGGLAGCVPRAPAPPPPAPAAPALSYDGTYRGTVRLSGLGAGVPAQGCATDPNIVLQVQNNAFTYSQPHPQAATSGPGGSATVVYAVAIAPDGSFSGQSQVSGTMTGTVQGGHMSGTINGLECVYSFFADRAS